MRIKIETGSQHLLKIYFIVKALNSGETSLEQIPLINSEFYSGKVFFEGKLNGISARRPIELKGFDNVKLKLNLRIEVFMSVRHIIGRR
jgi:hypothetical protein